MNIEAVNQDEYGSGYCLASCYLSIANYYGHNLTMEDLENKNIVRSDGYVNKWGDHFTRSDLQSYNINGIKSAIDNGTPVIIKGKSTYSQHFVVAYDYSGNTIKIMDPSGGEFGNLGSTVLKTWSGYYVCSE